MKNITICSINESNDDMTMNDFGFPWAEPRHDYIGSGGKYFSGKLANEPCDNWIYIGDKTIKEIKEKYYDDQALLNGYDKYEEFSDE